jgi:hypothetical protein
LTKRTQSRTRGARSNRALSDLSGGVWNFISLGTIPQADSFAHSADLSVNLAADFRF